ncbi:uncharacterized protein [Euwallacea similis]|uniref:uncharacterized protein n=1 Tax=Euwallacea similis TaxID=1736056 RepID=UPI00344B36A2
MSYAVVLLTVFCLSVVVRTEEGEDGVGDSLKLADGGFWGKFAGGRSENAPRSIHSNAEFNSNDRKENSKISLTQFLENFTKKYNKDQTTHDPNLRERAKDKANKWTLMDLQRHNHPFDDRNGWVSLDPVPWSVSKISKWQSKYKPSSERPWDEYDVPEASSQRPYLHEDDLEFNRPISITPPSPYVYHRPTESSDRFDSYYEGGDRLRPTPNPSKYPPRPTAYFGHKIHLETHFPSDSSTQRPYSYHNKKDCKHPYEDIITDGRPANFPQSNPYETFNRRGSEIEVHSEGHPFNGEGEWVLLSTTKGYKPPRNGARSLSYGATSSPTQTLRASRGVRLTVLPPLKGSNVNMTTSHGGLLQVESTFESVEQAKQQFDKKQNVLKLKGKRKKRKPNKHEVTNDEESSHSVVPQYGDPGAVMAAVGAGMIPATMAMMVPIAMNGK